MKRYVRTKDNKFHDTTKERYLIDGDRLVLAHEYETHPTMTDGNMVLSVYITEKYVDYINCGFVDKEEDDILDLIQVGDLVKITDNDNLIGDKFVSIDRTFEVNENFITEHKYMDFELLKIYTKQNDNYILVWDKSRGVI